MNKNDNKKTWVTILHFAVHSIEGAAIFLIIGAVAVGLGFLVGCLEGWGVSAFTIAVLTFLEHLILLVDAAAFVVYLYKAAKKAIKEL